jgi:hypothetical protein
MGPTCHLVALFALFFMPTNSFEHKTIYKYDFLGEDARRHSHIEKQSNIYRQYTRRLEEGTQPERVTVAPPPPSTTLFRFHGEEGVVHTPPDYGFVEVTYIISLYVLH